MHMRLWAAEGFIGSAIALTLTFLLVGPRPLMSGYASVIGWSTITVFLILLVQGFWIQKNHAKTRDESHADLYSSYQSMIFKWGGMHSALSIVATVFLIIHGLLLLPSLLEPSLALWLGAAAFAILLILNLSGLLTESARKSRNFRRHKRAHVLLALIVLILLVTHVEGVAPPLSFRSILPGLIVGLAAFLSLSILIPLTVQIVRARREHNLRKGVNLSA